MKRFITQIMRFYGKAGNVSNQIQKWFEKAGKGDGLELWGIWGLWLEEQFLHKSCELAWFECSTSIIGEHNKLSYQRTQIWDRKGSSGTWKLSTVKLFLTAIIKIITVITQKHIISRLVLPFSFLSGSF